MSLPASFCFSLPIWVQFTMCCLLCVVWPAQVCGCNTRAHENGTDPILLHDYDTAEGARAPAAAPSHQQQRHSSTTTLLLLLLLLPHSAWLRFKLPHNQNRPGVCQPTQISQPTSQQLVHLGHVICRILGSPEICKRSAGEEIAGGVKVHGEENGFSCDGSTPKDWPKRAESIYKHG